MFRNSIAIIAALLMSACSAPPSEPEVENLAGDWTLVPEDSQVAFVTIKGGDIGEAHSFKTVSGDVDAAGKAALVIDLKSVDTSVEIRDERMRDILFQVSQFPSATASTQIDPATVAALKPGEQKVIVAPLTLDLHGASGTFDAELAVTRISADRVSVETTKPVIVNAGTFALTDGLGELQELAGLPSISPAVPVTASLVFESASGDAE